MKRDYNKYGSKGIKQGLCEHCQTPLDFVTKFILINGHEVRLHRDCWTAILVTERLNPSPEVWQSEVAFIATTEAQIVRRYFLNKFFIGINSDLHQ